MCHMCGSTPLRVLHFNAFHFYCFAFLVSLSRSCLCNVCSISFFMLSVTFMPVQRLLNCFRGSCGFFMLSCLCNGCSIVSEALVVSLCSLSRSCQCNVCSIVSEALVVFYAVYHSFARLKFDRMFQLPFCSVYVTCLALFSQTSLVQSLRFFDVSSLLFWQYTALSFLTERYATYASHSSRMYCCVTLRTYLLQASIALHQSAPSAYNARDVRVLIASSKKYSHKKRPEVCSSAALTKMKPWLLCHLRRKTHDHCAQPACVYLLLPRGKQILISILAC